MAVTLVSTGVQFPDTTTQTTAANDIGVGQAWIAVSRTAGTTYTNSTGKPISIGIRSQGGNAILYVSGVIAARSSINNASNYIGAVAPPGATYYIQAGAPVYNWAELRA